MKPNVRSCLILTAIAAVATWTPDASAEGMLVGVDGAVVVPLGDWAEISGLGLGALGRFEYALDPQLSATARAGYISHFEKDDKYKTAELPVLAGVRYAFDSASDGLYVAGEAGLVHLTVRLPVAGGVFPGATGPEKRSDSELKLGATASAGYRSGDIDARAGVFIASLSDAGETYAILATIGYNFVSF